MARDAAIHKRGVLVIVPITQRSAKAFVALHHRHHRPPVGSVFQVGAHDGVQLRGVLMAGRPVARMLDDGRTLEVTRVATDGCPNACSLLYGAARRARKALGYSRVITYTLASEPGTTLKAAGWRKIGNAGGGSWSRPSRGREDNHPQEGKVRWEA
jgi:hypothetical protein